MDAFLKEIILNEFILIHKKVLISRYFKSDISGKQDKGNFLVMKLNCFNILKEVKHYHIFLNVTFQWQLQDAIPISCHNKLIYNFVSYHRNFKVLLKNPVLLSLF